MRNGTFWSAWMLTIPSHFCAGIRLVDEVPALLVLAQPLLQRRDVEVAGVAVQVGHVGHLLAGHHHLVGGDGHGGGLLDHLAVAGVGEPDVLLHVEHLAGGAELLQQEDDQHGHHVHHGHHVELGVGGLAAPVADLAAQHLGVLRSRLAGRLPGWTMAMRRS